ncbi:MAG: thioredoxin domain-containing protein [Acidobacteriota bacterium]
MHWFATRRLDRFRCAALSLALVFMLAIPGTLLASEDAGPAAPDLIAVKFHADWCGSCKKMGSTFEDLQNKYDGRSILFVELDLTNRTTRAQAEYLAASLGFGKVFASHPGTGFVLLLDGETRAQIAKLTADQSIKEMGATLVAELDAR